MRSWNRILVSCAMSVVLAAGMCPGLAHAGGRALTGASAKVAANSSVVDEDEFWDWDLMAFDVFAEGVDGTAVPNVSVKYDGVEVSSTYYTLTYETLGDDGEPTGTKYPEGAALRVGWYRASISVETSDDDCSQSVDFHVIDRYDVSMASAYVSQIASEGQPVDLTDAVELYFEHRFSNSDGYRTERLELDRDFKISGYQDAQGRNLDGAPSEAGEYEAVLEGIDPYHGSKLVAFTVIDAHDFPEASLWLSNPHDLVEDPDGVTPMFDGYIGSVSLEQDADFRVAGYENSAGVKLSGAPTVFGTYYAVLEGIEPYHGTQEVEFTVFRANDLARAYVDCDSSSSDRSYYGYTGNPVEPDLHVAMPTGVVLNKGVDFTVSYAEFDWETSGPGASLSGAPIEMGEYYAVVTATANGKYIGSNGCRFSIVDPMDLGYGNISSSALAYVTCSWNNGSPASPTGITVSDVNGKVLVEGKDYVFRYGPNGDGDDPDNYLENIADEGCYEVYAKGIGRYFGLAYGHPAVFACIAKPEHDITRAKVSMPATYAYEGGDSLVGVVDPVITLAGKILIEGRDYRLFFGKGNGETTGTLGEHTFYVIGLGCDGYDDCSYYGELALKYTVVEDGGETDISNAVVSGITAKTYTGKKATQSPVVKMGSVTLREGVDYTLSYKNNVNAGMAAVVIKGMGAYTGMLEKSFTIKKASLSSVVLKSTSGNYKGQAYKLAAKEVRAGSIAVPSADYAVSYLRGKSQTKDLKTAGAIIVKATAKKTSANYVGSATATFTIKQIANTMKLKAAAKTVKLTKGKKKLAKAATISGAILFSKKGQGPVTYAKVSKGSAKCLKIDKKTGKVTVAKGVKAGIYKLTVNVKAAGNKNYKAKAQRLTLTVRVKK